MAGQGDVSSGARLGTDTAFPRGRKFGLRHSRGALSDHGVGKQALVVPAVGGEKELVQALVGSGLQIGVGEVE